MKKEQLRKKGKDLLRKDAQSRHFDAGRARRIGGIEIDDTTRMIRTEHEIIGPFTWRQLQVVILRVLGLRDSNDIMDAINHIEQETTGRVNAVTRENVRSNTHRVSRDYPSLRPLLGIRSNRRRRD